jgi:hypothetical protein
MSFDLSMQPEIGFYAIKFKHIFQRKGHAHKPICFQSMMIW